ncbi:MAG: alpha-glucosidase [Frankiaceae bacterium]|nr:alpha-glucosidase [Frankiaceae bacterium]
MTNAVTGHSGRPWWHDAVVYQVYLRSFADSNGDGLGDLAGVRSRLPYLASLGVDALWLNPFYLSPQKDHGYDVADYYEVDPLFGTLEDFDALLADAHAHGLRIICDVVPNHSSSEHEWFKRALADPMSDERSRYIFRPPAADGGPPNNWRSVFSGPAWTLDEASGEYYLHLFDASQPDFNWRHSEVHAEWERILRFWLDRGVDGFRIDVAHGLYKDAELRDNPEAGRLVPGAPAYESINAKHNWDQPETIEVFRRWRQITDSYAGDRMMVGEVFLFDLGRVASYAGADRLHQAFNFMVMATPFEAAALRDVIEKALGAFTVDGAGPTWVLSNHDLVRHVTRYGGGDAGLRRAKAATGTLLALPGSPYLYQGEELGLEQADVPPEARQDPIWVRSGGTIEGRDGCRTPIPWTDEPPGYGFTTSATPWLPVEDTAKAGSVAAEEADPASTLAFYRRAIGIRREARPSLGDEVEWLATPAGTLGFTRSAADGTTYTCLLNTTTRAVPVRLPGEATVVLSSELSVPEGARALPGTDNFAIAVPGETCLWLRSVDPDRFVRDAAQHD